MTKDEKVENVSVYEAAKWLGCSTQRVLQQIEQGYLGAVRIGFEWRVLKSDLGMP